ncbi:hypothetical protein JXM67_03630 [candidate division WOR-3 bacterium]|nr:hypothetical protein [candidate division WOR-3 bacterium]
MDAEFKQLEEKIKALIQRVRELEAERDRQAAEIDELQHLRIAAAARLTGILNRLEEPE